MNEYVYSQITTSTTVQCTTDKTETDREYEQKNTTNATSEQYSTP